MHRYLIPVLTFLCLLVSESGFAVDCSVHHQLVVSITESWNDFRASIYLFEQTNGEWVRTGKILSAVVGGDGLAWTPGMSDTAPAQPVKKEGDKRAPAGVFPLSAGMGFSPTPPPGTTIPYSPIEKGIHCVDDSNSRYYNRIIAEKELPLQIHELWNSSEKLWELPDLYRLLILVGYNVKEPKPGDGSCIFMHIWRSSAEATTGCTALAETDLTSIMKWLKPEANPALVQLPRETYLQLWNKWRLPSPALMKESGDVLVNVTSVAPKIAMEMRYANDNNFTGRVIYDCSQCFLRKATADKVARVQLELRKIGLGLKLWDCYRPKMAQHLLWSLFPDPRFVADPKKGSRHNRGNAVDVTLVDKEGHELAMPTDYDNFSPSAAHAFKNLPTKTIENRKLLKETMQKAGFRPLATEWWHYDDAEEEGNPLDISFEELCPSKH